MLLLLSHLWLPYLISMVLMIAVLAVIDHGGFDAFVIAAVLELIPTAGLWCIRSGYIVPAVIIAALCSIAVVSAAVILLAAFFCLDIIMAAGGVVVTALTVISAKACISAFPGDTMQTVLIAACIGGMLSVVYILGFLSSLGKGMSE